MLLARIKVFKIPMSTLLRSYTILASYSSKCLAGKIYNLKWAENLVITQFKGYAQKPVIRRESMVLVKSQRSQS